MSRPMRSWTTRAELEHEVVTLQRDGLSRRAISRHCGISRNTVRGVLEAHALGREQEHRALPEPALRAPRASKLDPFKPRIGELLRQYDDITAQRVFERLRDEEGFGGGYTTVKRHVRALRPPPKPKPSLETPHYDPGQMGECDWSPYDIPCIDGHTESVQAFGYVLVHSRRKAYEVYPSNGLHPLMDGHEYAFDRFGGCAERCKYDSQKPVVLRWEGYQPIYNPRFLAFAAYYEFRPEAVRGDPNAKPRVERSFWEFETSFLNGRSFRDFADIRAQLTDWLDRIVDHRRRHGSTPLERFAEEQPHLVELPRHPYDTARVVYRVCSIDGFVDWEGNRYAVPYDHVTDLLPVRITERELFVYAADLECVAQHELARRGSGLRIDPHGYHPRRHRQSRVDLDQLRTVFEAMGQGAQDFFRLLRATPTRLWAHHTRQILVLRARYATDDLDAALGHAALYGAFDPRAVERIVAARSAPRTLDEYVAEETARRMANVLGERRTAPRDLSEYDHLPTCGTSRLAAANGGSTESSPCPNIPAPPATSRADEPQPLASQTTHCEPDSAPICPSSD
jgi:transposase